MLQFTVYPATVTDGGVVVYDLNMYALKNGGMMNIFSALSQGKGRLNEENMSAMLGFLLAPYQTHDIGDVFLRRFLDAVAALCEDEDRFKDFTGNPLPINAEILYEQKYALMDKTRAVDIEIRIYEHVVADHRTPREVHRIAIENKIKDQAADESQFADEFRGIQDDIGADPVNITMVFLTPAGQHPKLVAEFDALTVIQNHRKAWIYWHENESEQINITALIREILSAEAQAHINPISEYIRHTVKAFAFHIEATVTPTDQRPVPEIGELTDEVTVTISTGTYRIERYKSTTIKVYDTTTEQYESALGMLKQIINEKRLSIDLYFTSGKPKNTRMLGKEVIDSL